MSLGSPYNIGSTAAAAGVTTTVVTAGTDANSDPTSMPASGDAVFVLIGISSTASLPTGVTDSKGNTYTLSGKTSAGSEYCAVWECLDPGTTPVSGTTFTVTWSAATAATSNVRVTGCAGVASSAADDQSGTGAASSTSPAATAGGALAQASELVIAVCQSGSATAGVSSWGTFTQVGHNLRSGSGSYFGAAVLAASSTSPPSVSATLGASGGWGMLLLTFKAATGGGSGLAITNTSPLPAGQAAVAYTDQLAATGGVAPYTWAVTSGSLPTGLSLAPGGGGGGGGGGGDVTYVGANTGPQGAPDLAAFTNAYPTIGPLGCYKFFFGGGLPATWSGSLMDQITQAEPGTFCYLTWGPATMSAAAIAAFIATIPHTIPAVGFLYDNEPENGDFSSGAAFVTAYTDQSTKVRACQATTPVNLVMMTDCFMGWYQSGGDNSYIPPASSVDVYGLDLYDRKIYWAGPDMSTNKAWQTWTGYVKGLGKPLALTEYGISGAASDAEQNGRLQADWAYIQGAFGTGGTLSKYPLYTWLYWQTGGLAYGGSNINEMLGAATQATWAGIAGQQGGSSGGGSGGGGGGGGGGLISGTPAANGTATFTVTVTDSAGSTSSTAFSLTTGTSAALAITTASPLAGATAGTAYSALLTASGGAPPYTWAVTVGGLPSGLGLDPSSGLISGTPSATGAGSFTVQVTDSASATETAVMALTVSGGLTVTTTSLPGATTGTAYSAAILAAGGTYPYTYAVTAGSLPAGLSLDPAAGVISGTPTAGAPSFTVTVTDSAGDTATVTLSISVSGASGGGGQVGRRRFGAATADYVLTHGSGGTVLFDPGAALQFWDSLSGGTQYTDLTDTSGNPVTTITADTTGLPPEFYGPANVWKMAADPYGGSGPRTWMLATDIGDEVSALESQFAALTPLPGLVTGGVPVWDGVTWQCQLITDTSVDPDAGIQVAKLAAGGNEAALLTAGTVPAWVSPSQGAVVLNGATAVVVQVAAVTANSRIFLTIQSAGGTPGSPYVSARTAGVSFSVKSSAGDTSTCAWFILEPGT